MNALLPAWLWLTIGLLPVQIQSSHTSTLRAAASRRHRSNLSSIPRLPESSPFTAVPTTVDLPVALGNKAAQGDRYVIWRALLHKAPLPRTSNLLRDPSYNKLEEGSAWPRGARGRRHASSGARANGHLMRVGCVLGTCQVQNLSHRLYQLIGQSGREDSSPVNPRSPHSYG